MSERGGLDKPRLLVLASTYPRWAGDHEPGFVHELARRLTATFDVWVLSPHARGAKAEELLDGVRVVRFRYAPERFESLVHDGGVVANLKRHPAKWLLVPLLMGAQTLATWRLVRSLRPSVVHAHWLIPQGAVLYLLRLTGARLPPILLTSHGADLFSLNQAPLRWLKRRIVGMVAWVTVVSEAMRAQVLALGGAERTLTVQPMGVDLSERYTPGDEGHRAPDELLFVGRLVEKKGLRYLIEALPDVRRQRPEVRLTVAGFGPELESLRALAAEQGVLDAVEFLGPVPQSELPALYRRAAIFVAPFVVARSGDQEGLGLVMLEAAGCGCPVVASDLPAIRDVLEHRVPPADARALAGRLLELLAQSADERSREARQVRDRILAKFDWGAVAAGYRELLLRLARGTP